MMQGGVEEDMPDPEIEHALAAVARPIARSAFREELRLRFCSEAALHETQAPIVPLPDTRVARRRRILRYGGLLAAAGILAVGFVVLGSPAPPWKVIHLPEGTVVKVDGRPVPVSDRVQLARSLSRAKEIEVEHGGFVLQIGDLALFETDEGTRITLEGFERRGDSVTYGARLRSGRLRGVTGPAFRGHKMSISADLVDATVTGTAFEVEYDGTGDRVCCLDGEVQVSGPAIGPEPNSVSAKRMCTVGREAETPPKWDDAPPAHADPLRKLVERAREIWP